jgi:hypothetical protein
VVVTNRSAIQATIKKDLGTVIKFGIADTKVPELSTLYCYDNKLSTLDATDAVFKAVGVG